VRKQLDVRRYREGMRRGLPRYHLNNPYGRPLVPVPALTRWQHRMAQRLGVSVQDPSRWCLECESFRDASCAAPNYHTRKGLSHPLDPRGEPCFRPAPGRGRR
jgi:hypothetical protein